MSNGHKLNTAFIILLVCVMLLTTSSLAWMTMASTLRVSNLSLSVCTQNALMIAPDVDGKPGEWGTILDLTEYSKLFGALKPATFVASEMMFYSPSYGLDGRISEVSKKLIDENGALLPEFSAADEKQKEDGRLYVVDFWMKTESNDTWVSLSEPVNREAETLGSGTFVVGEPVWGGGSHTEEGNGTESAVRMALRVKKNGVIDEVTQQPEDTGDELMIIYEPNADGGGGLQETQSIKGGKLNGDLKLIQQKKSTWKDKSPALKDEVDYTVGEFMTEDTSLFYLHSNQPRHMYLYFWLEGQDADCTNALFAEGGKLLANLQFHGDPNINGKVHSIRLSEDEAKTR